MKSSPFSSLTYSFSIALLAIVLGGCVPGEGGFGAGAGQQVLAAPVLVNPIGLNKTSSTQLFAWQAVVNATSYTLEIKEVGGAIFSPVPAKNLANIVQTNIEVSGFQASKLYEWRVRSQAAGFTPTFSNWVQFGTANPDNFSKGQLAPAEAVEDEPVAEEHNG